MSRDLAIGEPSASGFLEGDRRAACNWSWFRRNLNDQTYPEANDVREALAYPAWRAEDQEVPLAQP